jgi:hypothetical protein
LRFLVVTGQTERKKKEKVCLDINRPSHGRTWGRTIGPTERPFLDFHQFGTINRLIGDDVAVVPKFNGSCSSAK